MSRRISRCTRHASLAAVFILACTANVSAANSSPPTFSKEVAPILIKHCDGCHRSGEIASQISFLSFETARPWAKAIKEKVLSREMPPWPADSNTSLPFRNDRRLSQRDINTLVAWVDSGALKGKDADLPATPVFPSGWLHPKGLKPDLVISLPGEFQAPATGDIPYVRLLAKVPFIEDKWIAAIQARPGNPALVHHMAITEVALVKGATPADLGPLELLAKQMGLSTSSLTGAQPAVTTPTNPPAVDMLGVYTPGTTLEVYGDGNAKLLKGGKDLYLDFNIHYQTTGKPENDRSMIALWFQPGPPKRQLLRVPASGETIIAGGAELLSDSPGTKAEGTRVAIPPIPPQAPSYEVIGVTGYTEPVTIYQFQPHAHMRCKDFRYVVVYPDGHEQTVLSVPRYEFNWQLNYELETPLKLRAGSKLIVTAHYDNSRNNKHNPAPDKEVYFRDQNQSWDEMFTPFIQYTRDIPDPGSREISSDREQNHTPITEVVGCLEKSSASGWIVTNATAPAFSMTQSTTSVAVKRAEATSLGTRQYRLLGIDVFDPSPNKESRVVVKGLLIQDANESRINVTSLQPSGEVCAK